jgi:hypothetical protein
MTRPITSRVDERVESSGPDVIEEIIEKFDSETSRDPVLNVVPINVQVDTETNVQGDIPCHSTCLTAADLILARKTYDFPSYLELFLPGPRDTMYAPPPGCLCVHMDTLSHGLRLPVPEYISNILRELNLCLTQITPLGMGALVVWGIYMKLLGQAQSIQNLALFYSLKQSPQSSNSVSGVQPPFYYFHQRP